MPQPTIRPLIKITSFIGRGRGGGGAGGGGGGVFSSGGQFGSPELNELRKIRINLVTLLDIEKAQTKYLGDRILKFARTTERKKLKKRETEQESKGVPTKPKEDVKKNPIVKGFFNGLQGLFSFFGNIFKAFLTYKVLEWVSKPENKKKVEDFVNLIGGIFKFINAVAGFGIDRLLSGISKLVDGGGITRIFGFLEAVVGFFTLKWLLNPTKIISDIKMIGNLFTKTIPNAINAVVNFFTKIIPSAATQAADDAVKAAGKGVADTSGTVAKGATEGAGAVAKGASTTAKSGATATKGAAAAAKGGAKITGKSILKALPIIGAVSSGIFAVDRAFKGDWLGAGMEVASGVASLLPGWGTAASLGIDAALIGRDIAKEQGIPMLAKGGIVTKPTQAIVGEAGPEAILPLDKLDSFMGLNKSVNDIIPKFMKLLTVPFTIIGAGIVALISTSLSKIPGIGPLIAPLIGGVASAFGLPPSLVAGLSKFSGKALNAIAGGMGGMAEMFGLKEPNIVARPGGKYNPTKDKSMRGLLGNILNILITKLKPSAEDKTTPPPAPAGTSPSPGAGGSPNASGGSSKPLPENASLAKAGNAAVQNLAGTQQDLLSKGYKLVPNTANRFWQDAEGRLYESKSIGSTLTGGEKFSLKAVTQEQIDKGFTSAGSQHTTGSRNNQEIQRTLSMFRIINQGGTLEKEILDTITQVKRDGQWHSKEKNRGGGIGGSGNGDKVRALLEPGEYVMNKNFVSAVGGPKVLDKYNFGMYPRFGNSISAQWGGHILRLATGGTVIEYITGDRSHPSYAADHGGGNYHDHLAFKSKAERDAAIKYLESKGWYVGSRNDGRHASGSYHYKDQAFDIPFYPNQSRKGVGDNASGESKLSSMLRADLAAGGFNVPGGPGMQRENDKTTPSPSQEEKVDWTGIAQSLGKLFNEFRGGPAPSESVAQAPPKITATPSAASSSLQSAQGENNRLQAQARTNAGRGKGNVVTLGNPNQVIQSSTTQPMSPSLGGTVAPTPLTIYPVAP